MQADKFRVSKPATKIRTCNTCKLRHQKCNGARPQCNNCEMRNIECIYGGPAGAHQPTSGQSSDFDFLPPRASPRAQTEISDQQYAKLRDQLLDDILKGFLNKGGNQGTIQAKLEQDLENQLHESKSNHISLPILHDKVARLVREQEDLTSDSAGLEEPREKGKQALFSRSFTQVRKILRDSLPLQPLAEQLLELFLAYENSMHFIYDPPKLRLELKLLYDKPETVRIASYCQILFMLAVATQYDDLDDAEGDAWFETARKYMDDALDEDPEDNLWVMRAMLLICCYQSPTSWNKTWIYIDTATRRAQRYQLDLDENRLKELSDVDYQQWRQLWLTVISIDRWIALILGRLPHVRESISRDHIFQDLSFTQDPQYQVPQNCIAALSILTGYILRDICFADKVTLDIYQRYNHDLDKWLGKLGGIRRHQVETGSIPELEIDEKEAITNLHFMHLGARIILLRPLLLRAVETRMSPIAIGPIEGTTVHCAKEAVRYARKCVESAGTVLAKSMPPKRSYLIAFFLINAAYALVLAVLWDRQQMSTSSVIDKSVEAELSKALHLLEYCGQRNTIARRYANSLKEICKRLLREPQVDMSSAFTAFRSINLATSPHSSVASMTDPPTIGVTGNPHAHAHSGFPSMGNLAPGVQSMPSDSFAFDETLPDMGLEPFGASPNESNVGGSDTFRMNQFDSY